MYKILSSPDDEDGGSVLAVVTRGSIKENLSQLLLNAAAYLHHKCCTWGWWKRLLDQIRDAAGDEAHVPRWAEATNREKPCKMANADFEMPPVEYPMRKERQWCHGDPGVSLMWCLKGVSGILQNRTLCWGGSTLLLENLWEDITSMSLPESISVLLCQDVLLRVFSTSGIILSQWHSRLTQDNIWDTVDMLVLFQKSWTG